MLKKKKQYHYLEERREKVTSGLISFKDVGNPEALHVIRVQIKKTIALLQLYRPLKKCKVKAFRIIFKHAGLVRDASVLLRFMKKHQKEYSFLIQEQDKLFEDHSRTFKVYADEYIKSAETFYSLFSRHLKPINRKHIVLFLTKELDWIEKILIRKHDPKELHQCRKRIKTLLYLYALLPAKARDKLSLNIAYLDTLQDIIGKWHDAVLADELSYQYEGIGKKTAAGNFVSRLIF